MGMNFVPFTNFKMPTIVGISQIVMETNDTVSRFEQDNRLNYLTIYADNKVEHEAYYYKLGSKHQADVYYYFSSICTNTTKV